MLKGYRGIFIAAVLGIGTTNPINGSCYAQNSDGQDQGKTSQKLPLIKGDKLFTVAVRSMKSEQDKLAANAEYERAQRDLKAQESMAKWAFWMLIMTAATTVISATGILLIWRQVSLTRQAVEGTSEATATMQEANALARTAQAVQLRPYVYFEKLEYPKPVTRYSEIIVVIRNYGQRPAYNVSLEIGNITSERPIGNIDAHTINMHQFADTLDVIAPTGERRVTVDLAGGSIKEWDDIYSNGDVLLVRIRLEYAVGRGREFHEIVLVLDVDSMAKGLIPLLGEQERKKQSKTA